jgi:hypothetical protein
MKKKYKKQVNELARILTHEQMKFVDEPFVYTLVAKQYIDYEEGWEDCLCDIKIDKTESEVEEIKDRFWEYVESNYNDKFYNLTIAFWCKSDEKNI